MLATVSVKIYKIITLYDSVYRLSINYSIMPIEVSGMLRPLCSIR